MRIAIIDDEPGSVLGVLRELNRRKIDTVFYKSVKEAGEGFRAWEGELDGIILDMQMPGGSGASAGFGGVEVFKNLALLEQEGLTVFSGGIPPVAILSHIPVSQFMTQIIEIQQSSCPACQFRPWAKKSIAQGFVDAFLDWISEG